MLIHGMHKTDAYATWEAMKQRCLNKKHSAYKYYGGKGIKVCEKWRDFIGFYEDMGDRPKGKSIDRIDPNGDYTKDNCRWANHLTQIRNRGVQSNSPFGLPGVSWHQGRFRVRTKIRSKEKHIGTTKDFFEACCMSISAKNKYWR